MLTKLSMLSFIIVHFMYVFYQQTCNTVQNKINLKCMFKNKKYRYKAIKQKEQSKLKSKRQDYNMK